jgi:2-isopropylmalate synthase
MAVKTRGDYFGLTTGIKTARLYPVSRMVCAVTGLVVQRNKAIVGRNAFAHEAGIHQDGMLKERSTYEIMSPEEVGVPKTDLVLGKHSGRHALRERVTDLGYHLADEQLETLFNDFKTLADKKKEVYDEDLIVLIEKYLEGGPAPWQLISLHTTAGTSVLPTATIAIRRPDGEIVQDAAIGDGPVDAIFKAVERVTGVHANLREFVVRSVTAGKDAQGEVTLELEVESDSRSFRGRAASTDIIEASAEAYINAVNAIATRRDREHPREVIGRPGAGA